jgi:hypothetical protein
MARIAVVALVSLVLGACATPTHAPAPIPSPHIDWRG